MTKIKKISDKEIDEQFQALLELYDSVGWITYTENPSSLRQAIKKSSYCYACFDRGELLGFIRGLSDSVAINYIQDILVNPKSHGKGIGTKLVQEVMNDYKNVRTHLLLTDDDPSQKAFYKKLDMDNTKELTEFTLNTFIKMKV